MSRAGLQVFDKAIQDANTLLKDMEETYGWQDRRNQFYAALHSVLHTFRDRLTVEQATSFAAQLPILIRGVFFEGWKPTKVPQKMKASEFTGTVRQRFQFKLEGKVEDLIKVVMRAVAHATSGDAIRKVTRALPQDYKDLFAVDTLESTPKDDSKVTGLAPSDSIDDYTDDRDTAKGQLISS